MFINEKTYVALPCGHIIGFKCANKVGTESRLKIGYCPLCRSYFLEKDIIPERVFEN